MLFSIVFSLVPSKYIDNLKTLRQKFKKKERNNTTFKLIPKVSVKIPNLKYEAVRS